MQNRNFTLTILNWFEENGRELPWRGTHDPYAIWLSEVILQQTRISQGTEYWHRFMQRWPTVEELAAASEDEVLKEWQGLGYYSRARNLHHAALQIVQQGNFPHTYKEIRALKGVGDYTAAAISSMAFSLPYAAVDGNVYRVLSRYFGISTPINSTEGKAEFQQLDNELLPREQAGTWNQAMMDFGAIQCTPSSPQCLICPLQEDCYALRKNKITVLPVKEKNIKRRERFFTYYYIRYQGQVAIHQRTAGDIWQGLWEPLLEEAAFPVGASQVKHILTHQTLYARMIVQEPSAKPELPEGYIWIKEEELENYALPRLIEKLL